MPLLLLLRGFIGAAFARVRNIPIIPALAVGVFLSVFMAGYWRGSGSCELKQVKADIKGIEKHDKIKLKIDGLTDAAVDKRLRLYTRD
jgi:hypothetical protein